LKFKVNDSWLMESLSEEPPEDSDKWTGIFCFSGRGEDWEEDGRPS
jgi:hypothetical protein